MKVDNDSNDKNTLLETKALTEQLVPTLHTRVRINCATWLGARFMRSFV